MGGDRCLPPAPGQAWRFRVSAAWGLGLTRRANPARGRGALRMSRKPRQTRLRAQARPPTPTCRPRVSRGNGVTRKPWHVSGVTSSPSKGALRPHPGLGAAWGAGGCARLPPAHGARTLPSPYLHLLSLQSVSALLAANGQTPCPRHSQAPGQLAPDPETGTLARLPSPVLLAGGRARDPEDSPWASLAAVNGLHAAWLSEKEKNRPSDPNWWKRF